MDEHRKIIRYSSDSISADLQIALLIKGEYKKECNVLNISSLGMKLGCNGLTIVKGERFQLMFSEIEKELHCECVHSVIVKDYCVIGAYIINPYDQAILEKALLGN